MNILFKKFLGFSFGPVFGAIISFITIPLTTYFISPAEFGKASMFSLFQILIVTFIYMGLDQAYTREYNEYPDKGNLFKNALFFPLVISIIHLIIMIPFAEDISYFLFGSIKYELASILFGVIIIFSVLERFILLSIRMQEKAIEYSVVNIFSKLNVLIITLIFVIFIRQDFLAVVYSVVLGQIITDFYLIMRYKSLFSYKLLKLDKNLLKRLISFGAPLVVAASLSSLLSSFDRVALRSWSNYYQVGIFAAALKIAATLNILQSSFNSFWAPVAYRWYHVKKEIRYYEFISKLVLLIMSVLFCIILLFKDFIVFLLGTEYMDTKYVIAFLCLHPIMYTISETTTLGITFSRKSYYNIWVSLFSLIPNVVICFLLVGKYGAIGAGIATGVSYIIFFLSRSYFSKKEWDLFPIKLHIIVSCVLFIAAIINLSTSNYILIVNLIILIIIIIIQIPTLNLIYKIYKKLDKREWEFS